ncbi:hypothetical protein K438DRAFT_1779648 [Mycena galopus ATCC 62051]|nr:hypothetical protein K438DRAFT_1779648 [Mycena galopus ATCC 62051]
MPSVKTSDERAKMRWVLHGSHVGQSVPVTDWPTLDLLQWKRTAAQAAVAAMNCDLPGKNCRLTPLSIHLSGPYTDYIYIVGGGEKQEEKIGAGAPGQRSGEEFGMM